MTEADLQVEYNQVLKRYNSTKDKMINLIEDKNCLIKHKYFVLKTDYIKKIGHLENMLFDLDIKLAISKRRIELANESIVQNKTINLAMIEAEIKDEFRDFLDALNSNNNEISIANYTENMSRLSELDLQELKRYYVGIAKLIYPDINSDLNDVQKSLWTKAEIAYENGEIQFLRIIYKLAQDETNATNDNIEKPIGELKDLIETFEERIKKEEREIAIILDNFPFNRAQLLVDKQKIREIQSELRQSIKEANSILELMEDHFIMMLDDTIFIN